MKLRRCFIAHFSTSKPNVFNFFRLRVPYTFWRKAFVSGCSGEFLEYLMRILKGIWYIFQSEDYFKYVFPRCEDGMSKTETG
jgi:hypothetical protein